MPYLTEEQKRSFIKDGFLVLRDIIPLDLVQIARDHCDTAYAEGEYVVKDPNGADPIPTFNDNVQKTPAIANLMTESRLFEACEDLIGTGKAKFGKRAQIAFRLTDQRMLRKKMGLTDPMPKHRWHIDGGNGKYKDTASAFTLLVGVCLSPGQDVDENRGQFNVWPGSHKRLHPLLCERVRQGLIGDDGHNLFGYGPSKPDMGQPQRVLLRPGDACLASQRLGHAGGVNLHEETRKNLYFRVSHKRHDDFLPAILEGCSVFTEFEGLHDLLEDGE